MDTPPSPMACSAETCFRSLMDSLDACAALVDTEGRVIRINSAWAACRGSNPFLLGVAPKTSYLQLCRDLVGSPDGNFSIIAMGIIAVLQGKVAQIRLEYPVQQQEETFWYSLVATRSHQADSTVGSVVQHLDITERMKNERRLRRTEQLFKAITENALDLISILDSRGLTIYTNPTYQRLLGYSTQEWPDLRFEELVHEEDRDSFKSAIREGFKSNMTHFFEFRMRRSNGTYCYLEGRAVVVDNATGDTETLLLISRDITARKDAEVEKASMEVQLRHAQKLEAIGQLAAGIAHEINTPTQYIGDNTRFLGEAFESLDRVMKLVTRLRQEARQMPELAPMTSELDGLCEREDLDFLMEEVPKAIRQSKDGLERVSKIVHAMKIFSHPGTEGQVSIDLNSAISNTLIVARNEWKYIAEVQTEFDPALPSVMGYPGEINQVILNLVVNAAHALEEKFQHSQEKGCIRIQTKSDGPWVECRVSDNGSGIPEKIRSKIFLPFFTTKSVGKGTGQGLAIVHNVVIRHGGNIDIQTEEGVGSTFIIRLPVLAAKE